MSRSAGGQDQVTWARELLASARNAQDLRQAQAILLPLELGLTLEQTASAIGRSVSMTCKLSNRRRREIAREIEPKKHKSQLRNHAYASLEQEAAALEQVLAKACEGGVVVIAQLLPTFEKALGKPLSLSTLYRICWPATAGANLPPIQRTPRTIPSGARTSKKLPTNLAQVLSTFTHQRPLRLMF